MSSGCGEGLMLSQRRRRRISTEMKINVLTLESSGPFNVNKTLEVLEHYEWKNDINQISEFKKID